MRSTHALKSQAGGTRITLCVSLIAMAVLVWALAGLFRSKDGGPSPTPVVVYCAAGIKPPVEAAARAYEKEFGIPVQLQYGGSGTLLSNIRVAKTGDLFIAADTSYVTLAREYGLIDEVLPLAHHRPVLAVPKGNPKGIRTLEDLWRLNLRVELANPETAAIGRSVRALLQKTGQWPQLEKQITVFKPTVNDAANDVKLGTVDAGIVWDATAAQYPELEIVRVPELEVAMETVSVAVLKFTRQPTAALRFARYLAARDRGLTEFTTRHFEAVEGDAWADAPELLLCSGAMLRPGIEQTLKEFEQREGCRITTVYNGCGILVAQMRTGQRPDAYFSCDTTFMNQVADLYVAPVDIVENRIALLVPKGNPKQIRTPQDLLKPGMRVGLPHREKSAMGNVIWKLLDAAGVYGSLGDNLKLESPTGDFLVNQLRTGSLDVVMACQSNYVASREHLEAIPVEAPLSRMTQPYAVGRSTSRRFLAERLEAALTSDTSRQRMEQSGFVWRHGGMQRP